MNEEVTIFNENGLMVVANMLNEYSKENNQNYQDFLRGKCESEQYYVWGAYEELCKMHNTIVRAHGADILQFNGDLPIFPETEILETHGEKLTQKFYNEVVSPNADLFAPDDPTVEVLQDILAKGTS